MASFARAAAAASPRRAAGAPSTRGTGAWRWPRAGRAPRGRRRFPGCAAGGGGCGSPARASRRRADARPDRGGRDTRATPPACWRAASTRRSEPTARNPVRRRMSIVSRSAVAERGAAHHHGGVRERVGEQAAGSEWRRRPCALARCGGASSRWSAPACRRCRPAGWLPKRNLSRQAARQADVVCVHARQVRPARQLDGPIERGGDPGVRLVADAYPTVPAPISLQDVRRGVGGAVVGDDGSRSEQVCRRMLSIASGRKRLASYAGIRTLTSGTSSTGIARPGVAGFTAGRNFDEPRPPSEG